MPLAELTCKMGTVVPPVDGWRWALMLSTRTVPNSYRMAPGVCDDHFLSLWSSGLLTYDLCPFYYILRNVVRCIFKQCCFDVVVVVIFWLRKKRKFTGFPCYEIKFRFLIVAFRVFYNLTRTPGFDWRSILPLLRMLWVVATRLMSTLVILINVVSSTFWAVLL